MTKNLTVTQKTTEHDLLERSGKSEATITKGVFIATQLNSTDLN